MRGVLLHFFLMRRNQLLRKCMLRKQRAKNARATLEKTYRKRVDFVSAAMAPSPTVLTYEQRSKMMHITLMKLYIDTFLSKATTPGILKAFARGWRAHNFAAEAEQIVASYFRQGLVFFSKK